MGKLFVGYDDQMKTPTCDLACLRHAVELINCTAGNDFSLTQLGLKIGEKTIEAKAFRKPSHERTYLVVSGVPGLLVHHNERTMQRMLWGKYNEDHLLESKLKIIYEEKYGISYSERDWFASGVAASLKELLSEEFNEAEFRANLANYDIYRSSNL